MSFLLPNLVLFLVLAALLAGGVIWVAARR